MEDIEDIEAIEVPADALSPGALRGLIEAFVLREGTDYGEREFSLDEKVAQIEQQLVRREVRVMYDPVSETATLVSSQGLPAAR
jgi:uncharacterized protein YheU (UPF0270 family)